MTLIPVGLNETKSFTNSGTAPLEFMIIGIARDMAAKEAFMISPLGMTGVPRTPAIEDARRCHRKI